MSVQSLERVINFGARKVGLQVSRLKSGIGQLPIEATESDKAIIRAVQPFTMTSSERLWSLLNAVRYLESSRVAGDFVECGVWRGGSVMAMAHELGRLGTDDKRIWLYDTFTGMTKPTSRDVESVSGISASTMLSQTPKGDGNNVWCVASRTDVESNLRSTGYPLELFTFVEGDVAQTLRRSVPAQVGLLRLDTDWYESTKASLEVLYPRLAVGGVCILDDYGHWRGARAAVDDYFAEQGHRPYMHAIDFSGRVFIKNR